MNVTLAERMDLLTLKASQIVQFINASQGNVFTAEALTMLGEHLRRMEELRASVAAEIPSQSQEAA